jgi:site-specific DNA-adenine methylase
MIKAPFPWFGGKSRVADIVWSRLGEVKNYVEPFFGSGAVLLSRPHPAKTETVNDLDCYLANFWRAVHYAPAETAKYVDWPVNEADLHARHLWIVNQTEFRERMKTDPAYYDAKIAGWWVWGLCQWIGSGWCANAGMGVHRKRPHLSNAGMGVHRKLPHLGDAGMGVHRQLPHLGDAGRGELINAYFEALAARLRNVRVCCGSWERVLGPSVTVKHGITGVFLDPPYAPELRESKLYSVESDVSREVFEWAKEHGGDPKMRIAVCGYEGEHKTPSGWLCLPWKAPGGYGSQGKGRGRANAGLERIWFSPHCIA